MIKNTKGNKSYTRPLPIRMLAILMAVVMVLSVLYINNSKGFVKADGEEAAGTTITDSSFLTTDRIGFDETNSTCTIFVPYDSSLNNKVTFSLPEYADVEDNNSRVYKFEITEGEGETATVRYEYSNVNDLEGTGTEVPAKSIKRYYWVIDNKQVDSITSGSSEVIATRMTSTSYYVDSDEVYYTDPIPVGVLNIVPERINPITLSVDDETFAISENEESGELPGNTSSRNGENKDFYYGSISYSVEGDETSYSTISALSSAYSDDTKPDAEYTVTKKIVSGTTVLASTTANFTKSVLDLAKISVRYNGSDNLVEYPNNSTTVNITGVNSKEFTRIIFEAKEGKTLGAVTVEPQGSAPSYTSGGGTSTQQDFTFDGVFNPGETYSYKCTVASREITVNISCGDGTPSISGVSVEPKDETVTPLIVTKDSVDYSYVKDSSAVVKGTVSVASDSGAVISGVELLKKTESGFSKEADATISASSSVNAEIDTTLSEGENTYKLRATSSFEDTTTGTDEVSLYLDTTAPSVANVTLSQTIAGTGMNYSDSAANPGTAYTSTQKISKNAPATISITPVDEGCGLASSGVVKFGEEPLNKNGDSYEYEIPANTDATSFEFTIYDALGNSGTFTVNVVYFDDSIVIKDRKVVDSESIEYQFATNDFITWTGDKVTDKSKRGYSVVYTVETAKDVTVQGATINYDEISNPDTIPYSNIVLDDSGDKNVYTISTAIYPGDISGSKTNICLTVSNINDVSVSDELTVLNINIDSAAPINSEPELKTGTDISSDAAIQYDGWYKKDLVLHFVCNDGSLYSSGLKEVEVISGVDNQPTIGADGSFFAIVSQSDETSKKTDVELKIRDNVGNVTEFSRTYKVDGKQPVTGLAIDGVTTYDGGLANLKTPPNITFDPSDTLSGWDDNNTNNVFTISDGTTTDKLEIGTKSLQYYITKYNLKTAENTVYTIDTLVYDVVGNVSEHNSKRIKVDGSEPKSGMEIKTPPTNKISQFYNSSVDISLWAKDANISNSGLKVYDKVDDNEFVDVSSSVSFTISDTDSEGFKNASGTYIVPVTKEGKHTVKFEVTDDSGNSTTAKSVVVYIDTTDPVVVGNINGVKYESDNSFQKSLTTDASVNEIYQYDAGKTTVIKRISPDGETTTEEKTGVGPFDITEDGEYEVTYTVKDKAGNKGDKKIKFTVDNSKPVHNMYITTADPAKVAKYNNTYSNKVGKFSGHSDQEEYTYGQYYNTDVSIDFSFFDYNIKSAQVTDNGSVLPVNWSFNGPYGKGSYTISSEGYHEIVFSSTDHSDNTTTDSGTNQKLRFTIDKSAPTISTSLNGVRYSEGSGVRYFNTNGTIDVSVSDANIDGSDLNRINRMTVPGSSVSVSEASVGEGAETFSTEADYEVQYYAIDRAGNRSDTRTVMFRVDKTAPQLQVSNVGAVSTAGSQNVSFNVKEAFFSDMNNVTIKIYKRVEGRAEVLEKTIDFKPNSANDSTSYTFSEDAEYRIEFTAEDKCGNKSNTDYSFIKDGTAPLITLSGVSNYDKTDKNVELTVIIDEAFYSSNRVTLSGTRTDINGKSNAITFDSFVTNRSKISQLQQLFKEDGIYDITVTSTDKAGNSSSKGVHFTIDTTDPVIGDLSKYDGIRTNSFKWDTNLDDLVTDLTVCDIKVYMDGSLYDGTSDVEDGSHVLKIEATDELGHTTTKEVTFVIDSRGPNIIISNVEDGDNLLESTEVIVTVELDEDSLDTVMLNDKAVEVKDNQAKLTVNKKGKYTLSATAHDEAGNASSAEIKFTFGKQTNLLLIGIIAGILILLLLALLVVIKRRQKDQ